MASYFPFFVSTGTCMALPALVVLSWADCSTWFLFVADLVRPSPYVRLPSPCVTLVCTVRVCRVGFVRSALLLAVGMCAVLSFEALPGLSCFIRVARECTWSVTRVLARKKKKKTMGITPNPSGHWPQIPLRGGHVQNRSRRTEQRRGRQRTRP